jgi:hypothetical protein
MNMPLSPKQVRDFPRDKNIQPLLVKDVGDEVTVVLYKEPTSMGYYNQWC